MTPQAAPPQSPSARHTQRPDPHGGDSGWTKPYAWAAAGWIALVQFVGSRPGDQLPPAPGVPGIDKVAHGVLYGITGFLLYRATMPTDPGRPMGMDRPALFAVSLAVVLGMVEEINQLSVPKRSGDALDWIADSLGALLVVGVAAWINARNERRHYGLRRP